MGQSLADLLGPALAAAEAAQGEVVAAEKNCPTTETDPLWESLRHALAEACHTDVERITKDWKLVEDGDLHPIARYGVVAKVESEFNLATRDKDVNSAQTAGHLRACFKRI